MRLPHADSRLADLLADRALFGLSEAESGELRALLIDEPEIDEWALDRAATALYIGLGGLEFEPTPASVRVRLQQAGTDWTAATPPARTQQAASIAGRIGRSSARLAWLAAAACLALAVVAWWPSVRSAGRSDADVLAYADVLRVAWAPGPDDAGEAVSGEVVWSDEAQAGYMEFRGLESLDPSKWQYQLWIVDPGRDTHPVDGGVFDVPPGAAGTVRVPIDAKLPVERPTAFVVTVEQPGGVVVSRQERIAAIAVVGG